MNSTLATKLISSLLRAAQHNSSVMVAPEVVLWPDPEGQWGPIVADVQAEVPGLLCLGVYAPGRLTGPVTWLKCMVGRVLDGADWGADVVPVIYLPGFSIGDLQKLGDAALELQPLLEYVHTGTVWRHRNGKEWTVSAFLQNEEEGLGLNLAQDHATKEAVLKVLPLLYRDAGIHFPSQQLDSSYFQSLVFPDLIAGVLSWLEEGDRFLSSLEPERRSVFAAVFESRFGMRPETAGLVDAARMLGSQKQAWKGVWDYFANAPQKYPQTVNLLRQAKPAELGTGLFAIPEESWPQVNEAAEEALRAALASVATMDMAGGVTSLRTLEVVHCRRRAWVWAALNHAPLAACLPDLLMMAEGCLAAYPSGSLDELKGYYRESGHLVDRAMRDALELLRQEKDRKVVVGVIDKFYRPWLTTMAERFQVAAEKEAEAFMEVPRYGIEDGLVLFVDALRYELAVEYMERLNPMKLGRYAFSMETRWSALPSLTNTAKAAASPVADAVNPSSRFEGFYPQNMEGKEMNADVLRKMIALGGRKVVGRHAPMDADGLYWMEIGDIDKSGHDDGAKLVHRLDELFVVLEETLEHAFACGLRQVRIVTDHGWLLLPGGLPKAELPMAPVDERLGRCAMMKEGAKSALLHLPWRWNPAVHIAYAKGIDFHKKNVEYAHGGLSVQECLVPDIVVRQVADAQSTVAKIVSVKWVGLRCTVAVEGGGSDCYLDIRRKLDDENTSLVVGKRGKIVDGLCKLMVDDSAEGEAAHVALFDGEGMRLDRMVITVGENHG